MSKYVISKVKNTIMSVLFDEDGNAVEVEVEPGFQETKLNDIYLARVSNIVRNINAAFLTIENGVNSYLSLKDKVPYLFGAHSKSEQLCIGDEVIVQFKKEDIKRKQPSVSGKLELSGKYLVLIHGGHGLLFSQKIKDETERDRLRQILLPYAEEKYGYIIRTNAVDVSSETLKKEAEYLKKEYTRIKESGGNKTQGSLLYRSHPWYIDTLRDMPQNELTKVVTDLPEVFSSLKEYTEEFQPEDTSKLSFYQDSNLSLTSLFSFQRVMKEALSSQVWLKSGAFLVIEPTETMTVIDVNTGKAIHGQKDGDAMFLPVNLEAAKECMRQIRLRNLSGMILIDFISMESEQANDTLMSYLRELKRKDRIPVSVVDMTGLKLVELTRKKVKKPLHEQKICELFS